MLILFLQFNCLVLLNGDIVVIESCHVVPEGGVRQFWESFKKYKNHDNQVHRKIENVGRLFSFLL